MSTAYEGSIDEWFQHKPLQKVSKPIRLLRIMAGSEYPIRCKIEHYPTATGATPYYRCLSYTWGEPELGASTLVILLDNKLFHVRRNLWHFLQQARSKPLCDNMPWWIDALCIDQTNAIEKNHTVQMMGQIYESATSVVTWLGAFRTCSICTPAAKELLPRMLQWRDTVKQPPFRTHENKRQQIHEFAQLRKLVKTWYPPGKDDLLEELTMALHASVNEYWKRAWILQELKLAVTNSLWADDVEMELLQVKCIYLWSVEVLAHYESDHVLKPDYHRALVNTPMRTLLNKEHSSWENQPLLNVLRDFNHAECQDIHDRIYSVLALSLEGPEMIVDYACSRTSLFFQCLWTTRDNFCYCSAAFLIERLELKQSPDEDMARLFDDANTQGSAIDLGRPFVQATFTNLTTRCESLSSSAPPDARASLILGAVVFTCACSDRAYPPTWKEKCGLILCLGKFGANIGLRSAVCNIFGGLHLFFARSNDEYQVSEFADYRSHRKKEERLRILKAGAGYSFEIQDKFKSESENADQAGEAVLSMTPSAFVQLVREFGSNGLQCFKSNANSRFSLHFNYQPGNHDSHA